ncbi:MAG: kelch repeat-containing protein, partial [Gammaproteobacteria bacterium]
MPRRAGRSRRPRWGRKVFAIGGIGPQGLANDLFVYEPSKDSWITKSPAPTKRDHLAAAALGALFYVAGGREKSLAKNLA